MKEVKIAIISLVALAISLAFLIYFIIISIHLNSVAIESNLNIYSKASAFDSKIHDLMQEHTFLMVMTATRSLNGSASFNASYEALDINVKEISAQIANIYGTSTANQYLTLQIDKINDFLNYTLSVRNGISNANSIFVVNMNNDEQAIASFWSNTTGLDESQIKELIAERVNDEKMAVDNWYKGDYTNYFGKLHDAYNNMGIYADIISAAIIKQNPAIFQ
jgi:hypothetical protein